jgi:hypothetical protein
MMKISIPGVVKEYDDVHLGASHKFGGPKLIATRLTAKPSLVLFPISAQVFHALSDSGMHEEG